MCRDNLSVFLTERAKEADSVVFVQGVPLVSGRSFLSGYQTGEFQLVCIKVLFLRLRLTNQVRPDRFVLLKRASDFIGLLAFIQNCIPLTVCDRER